MSLPKVARRVAGKVLLSASAGSGGLTGDFVKETAAHTGWPIILTLSKPRAQADANAADLIVRTVRRVLVATGGPFPPVTFRGVTYAVEQVNNAVP